MSDSARVNPPQDGVGTGAALGGAPPRGRGKPVIGLLGGPGSGKSLVAKQMASLGCGVIDADRLAKEAIEEPDVKARLVEWWGPGVLTPEGRVDRKAVASIVFNDADALSRLEGVVHPKVAQRRAALRGVFEADPSVRCVVEDVPLLIEKNMQGMCDVLVFVDAPRSVRLERLRRTRGWGADELDARENHQASLDTKRRVSDYVLDNSAGEAELFGQVRRVLSQISPETS